MDPAANEVTINTTDAVLAPISISEPQPVEEEEQEEDYSAAAAAPETVAAPTTTTTTTKKVSAKEFVLHMKNLKRKIAEQDAQLALHDSFNTKLKTRALCSLLVVFNQNHVQKQQHFVFQQWRRFVHQEETHFQLENAAQLANKLRADLETSRNTQLVLESKLAESEVLTKKLKSALLKQKNVNTEQSNKHLVCPVPNFSLDEHCQHVFQLPHMRVVQMHFPELKSESQFEFRDVVIVKTWLKTEEERNRLDLMQTREETHAKQLANLEHKLQAQVSNCLLQLETEQENFMQYRLRAERALERAQQEGSLEKLVEKENEVDSLKREVFSMSAEREMLLSKLEEFRLAKDEAQSLHAQLQLKHHHCALEQSKVEAHMNELQKQVMSSKLEFATLQEQFHKEKLSLQEESALALQRFQHQLQEAEDAHKLAMSTVQHQFQSQKQQDREEFLKERNLLETKISALENQVQVQSRVFLAPTTPAAAPIPPISAVQPQLLHSQSKSEHTPKFDQRRRDSDMSSLEAEASGGGAGSRYFVDQIGALRNQIRNERIDFAKERTTLKTQVEDASKRKEEAEARIAHVEKLLEEVKLNQAREHQLLERDGLIYLKNAVFRFITADADSERDTLLPVLTMLLKFSPDEVKQLSGEQVQEKEGFLKGWLNRLKQ